MTNKPQPKGTPIGIEQAEPLEVSRGRLKAIERQSKRIAKAQANGEAQYEIETSLDDIKPVSDLPYGTDVELPDQQMFDTEIKGYFSPDDLIEIMAYLRINSVGQPEGMSINQAAIDLKIGKASVSKVLKQMNEGNRVKGYGLTQIDIDDTVTALQQIEVSLLQRPVVILDAIYIELEKRLKEAPDDVTTKDLINGVSAISKPLMKAASMYSERHQNDNEKEKDNTYSQVQEIFNGARERLIIEGVEYDKE